MRPLLLILLWLFFNVELDHSRPAGPVPLWFVFPVELVRPLLCPMTRPAAPVLHCLFFNVEFDQSRPAGPVPYGLYSL